MSDSSVSEAVARPSRRRRHWVIGLGVLLVASALAGAGTYRYLMPLPTPTVQVSVATTLTIGAPPLAIPLPAQGSFALRDSASGVVAGLAPSTVRPIASITKTMTALAVLAARPLAPGAAGPSFTVSAADVALLQQVIADDGSHVNVNLGEQLTERQLLLGMMLPSANNFALMLARWIDGSDAAFVDRMNQTAARWGMTATHFADPDGLSANTVSNASDLLLLGSHALLDPTLLEVMGNAQATLPDGTTIHNLDPLVATVPGWLGIKTGHTNAGGYCLLFAVRRSVTSDTPALTMIGAVLGQGQRSDTFQAAQQAVDADVADYVALQLDNVTPQLSGKLQSAWGASAALRIDSAQVAPILVQRGTHVHLDFVAAPVARFGAASNVGMVRALLDTRNDNGQATQLYVGAWPVVTAADLAGPPWWWRLRR